MPVKSISRCDNASYSVQIYEFDGQSREGKQCATVLRTVNSSLTQKTLLREGALAEASWNLVPLNRNTLTVYSLYVSERGVCDSVGHCLVWILSRLPSVPLLYHHGLY